MNVGKDGKWDEKMEFFNGKDGIDGGIWTVKQTRRNWVPPRLNEKNKVITVGVNPGLAGRLGE